MSWPPVTRWWTLWMMTVWKSGIAVSMPYSSAIKFGRRPCSALLMFCKLFCVTLIHIPNSRSKSQVWPNEEDLLVWLVEIVSNQRFPSTCSSQSFYETVGHLRVASLCKKFLLSKSKGAKYWLHMLWCSMGSIQHWHSVLAPNISSQDTRKGVVETPLRRWQDLGSKWIQWASTQQQDWTCCWQHQWSVLCSPWGVEAWHSTCQSLLQWSYLLCTG